MRQNPKSYAMFCVLLMLGVCLALPNQSRAEGYLSPVSVVAGSEGKRLYVAESTADQIAVLALPSGKTVKRIPVAANPKGLALSAPGQTLFVSSAQARGQIQVIDLRRGKVTGSIRVGHTPVSLCPGPDGQRLYVCNQFDHSVSIVDLPSRKEIATVPVTREPVAAALTTDGRYLFVANHLPAGPANTDYLAAVVSVIDTVTRQVVQTIELPDGSTNLAGIALAPNGRHAYVTHVLARYQFPVTYLERGWVNTNALTVLDVKQQRYINTVLLDDAKRGAANPHGVTCAADGKHILITHAGTHELSVIRRAGLHTHLVPAPSARGFRSSVSSTPGQRLLATLHPAHRLPNDLSFVDGIRRRLKFKGNGPRGLTVVGTKVYAAEYYSDSIGVIDINPRTGSQARSLALQEKQALTEARLGEMLFHDATQSFQHWHSCASCHSGNGRACALNWDLLNDGICNPKNTKSLLLTHETPPAMSTGVRANAEVAVRSGIRYIQFAYASHTKAGAMNAYLKTLAPVPSPYFVQGKLSPAARRGEGLFVQAGCARCHAGPLLTNLGKYDVGTATDEDDNPEFDTPTLVEVWRTSPYLHDGRATTIQEVLTTYNTDDRHGHTSDLNHRELADLAEYVLTR